MAAYSEAICFVYRPRRGWLTGEPEDRLSRNREQAVEGLGLPCAVRRAPHSRRNGARAYFFAFGAAGTGMSELYVSTMHFHLLSDCFFQTSRNFPLSLIVGPPFGSLMES